MSVAAEHRERALRLPASERVDYLCEVIDSMAAAWTEHHAVDDLDAHLNRSQRRILMALYDARGRPVSRESLLTAMHFDRAGDMPQEKLVDVLVCRIRKKMPESWRIVAVRGFGFRLEMPKTASDAGRAP